MKNLNERSVRILASLGLILTTMIWGFAFVVMKNSVDLIPPTYLLAIRFSMSAVLLALLFHKNLFAADRQTILCGAILGIFLCLSYQFQTYGLKYTTASKNAFITTLYVIIVPFFYWIVSKKRPTGRNIAAAFIAVIGLALLSLQGDLTINFGDFLTLVCGLMFAVHMVFIDKFTEHHDPIALTVIQILAAAIINWIKRLHIGDPSFPGICVWDTVFRDLLKGCADRKDVSRMRPDVCGTNPVGASAEEKNNDPFIPENCGPGWERIR